jgi:hypothetical protein
MKSKRVLLAIPLTLAFVACGDDDGGGGSASDWCDVATQVQDQDQVFEDMDFTNPETIEEAFTSSRDLLDDAVGEAPDEIRDDVETVRDGFATLVDELEAVDFDFMQLDTAVLDEIGVEVQEASDRIAAYSEEECGIESDDGADTTDATDDGATDDTVSDEGGEDATATTFGGGSVNDIILQQFVAMGMTEEQAECLLGEIDVDEFMSSGDTSAFLEAFSTCDIDPTSLGG